MEHRLVRKEYPKTVESYYVEFRPADAEGPWVRCAIITAGYDAGIRQKAWEGDCELCHERDPMHRFPFTPDDSGKSQERLIASIQAHYEKEHYPNE